MISLQREAVHLTGAQSTQADIYLHLLKRTLTRIPLHATEQRMLSALDDLPEHMAERMPDDMTEAIRRWAATSGPEGTGSENYPMGPMHRVFGLDWPETAETMVGLLRLDNVDNCVRDVLDRGVPGDLLEAGVWRGGCSILMRGILRAYNDAERRVWVADSFQGVPPPDPGYPADAGLRLDQFKILAVSKAQVAANFAEYGLLDDRVRFLQGWFRDTLPSAPVESIAVLRLDGDLYESTIQALRALYHKVSVGGYVIVDDYSNIDACRYAVHDFRDEVGSHEPIRRVDWAGMYWRKDY